MNRQTEDRINFVREKVHEALKKAGVRWQEPGELFWKTTIAHERQRVQELLAQPSPNPRLIAPFIDHTLLKPEAGEESIRQLCHTARTFQFGAVCVNPLFVAVAAEALQATSIKVCSVVGFPLGASKTEVKVAETRQAIADGASEVDMVLPIGLLKESRFSRVFADIHAVVAVAAEHKVIVKVILETALLNEEEKIAACELAALAGAAYVKTSTGFGPGGATEADVALMRQVVDQWGLGVKAAGGIRTTETAFSMLRAGATRIGASASVKLVGGTEST